MKRLEDLARGAALLAALGFCVGSIGCGQPTPPIKPSTPTATTPSTNGAANGNGHADSDPVSKPEGGSSLKPKAGGGVDVPGDIPEKAAGEGADKPAESTPAKEGDAKEGDAKEGAAKEGDAKPAEPKSEEN